MGLTPDRVTEVSEPEILDVDLADTVEGVRASPYFFCYSIVTPCR